MAQDLVLHLEAALVADAWVRYQRHTGIKADSRDPDWWAISLWMEREWWADEARVRDGLLRIVAQADGAADYEIIGAWILEDFAGDFEDAELLASRVAWLEQQAPTSESLRLCMAKMWVWHFRHGKRT